jgi:hypothetical protein
MENKGSDLDRHAATIGTDRAIHESAIENYQSQESAARMGHAGTAEQGSSERIVKVIRRSWRTFSAQSLLARKTVSYLSGSKPQQGGIQGHETHCDGG